MTARMADWRSIRRACEREAVQRAWAVHWREAARMAREERGDMVRVRLWGRLARRASARAARLRAKVMAGGR